MSYPSPPPADRPASASAGTAPSSVRTAALLVYALVGLAVIRTIIAIVAEDTLIDAYVESGDSSVNTEFARDAAPAYIPIAIGSLVIFGGLMLLTAYFFTKGKSWARITAIVICVLGVLVGLVSFLQPAPVWYQLLGVLSGLLSLGVIVMLLRADARAFSSAH
jgi:glucose-6-phosphate-specific signal transduction histidine kinase